MTTDEAMRQLHKRLNAAANNDQLSEEERAAAARRRDAAAGIIGHRCRLREGRRKRLWKDYQ